MRRFFELCQSAFLILAIISTGASWGQDSGGQTKNAAPSATLDKAPQPPAKVDVKPAAPDSSIKQRLVDILSATGWFENVDVNVRDGVVTLSGITSTEDYRKWAEDLSRNTQDVAAVVNRIDVRTSDLWDLRPAQNELSRVWTSFIRWSPHAMWGVLVLLATVWGSKLLSKITLTAVGTRIQSPLLQSVFAESVRLVLLIVGLYLVLYIFGMTQLAVTVIGGTGLLGLVLGIAFRDISENFLASVFLSIQPPFKPGDLVSIGSDVGYVQSLTTRATVIMTLDGNHIQIPNSTIYKSIIRNFTSNPNRRESFNVGIGYKEDIVKAQNVALKILNEHPAVMKTPEPQVLVDNLGSAAVNLQIYFWMNGDSYSWLSVRSSIIRLVKQAFDDQNITIPFESRSSLPPRMTSTANGSNGHPANGKKTAMHIVTSGEGSLESDAAAMQSQADNARLPEAGSDLLAHDISNDA